jgi:hypothetical protein
MALTTFNFSLIHQSSWRSLRAYRDISSNVTSHRALEVGMTPSSLLYLVSTVPALAEPHGI